MHRDLCGLGALSAPEVHEITSASWRLMTLSAASDTEPKQKFHLLLQKIQLLEFLANQREVLQSFV